MIKFFFRHTFQKFTENFSTTIFSKKATIDLFKNYLSFTPLSYKIDLVKTLIHRAFKI